MRKTFFLILLGIITYNIQAQSKLGLRFSPSISSNRVSLIDSLYDVEAAGPQFKFGLGLIYDHEITETYYLSTGIVFVPKYVGFNASEDPDAPAASPDYPKEPTEEYRVNYLQVPVSLKLFTNEVQPDMRIYFQVGMSAEFKVFNEPMEEDYDLIEAFKSFDSSVLFGAGVEYRAGINTTIFGGFTYQRGLTNIIKTTSFDFQEELQLRNTVVSLDLGLKF